MKTVIFPFYLCWIIPSVLLSYIPLPENISSFQLSFTFFFCIGLYLLLASSLSYWVIKVVINEKAQMIFPFVGGSFILFLFIYIWGVYLNANLKLLSGISTANLFFCASLIGAALSSAIKRPGELVPVCITAAIADLISVMKGPSKSMVKDITAYYDQGMEGAPPFIDFILIKVGIPGYEIPVPLFGVTDWILLVLLSSALIRLQMNDNLLASSTHKRNRIYLPVSAVALFVGLVFAQVTQQFIPAMVFIALFFLVYLIVKIKVHKSLHRVDIIYSLVFPAIVVASLMLFVS